MKVAALITLVIITACSSQRAQETIPPFQKEIVCSNEALAYLKKDKPLPANQQKYTESEIYSRMLSLEPAIRNCYEEEIARTNKSHTFNLCFVVGYNAKGIMDFFEFSTKEITLTTEFKECLVKLKARNELKGFKSLVITQPFRLHPVHPSN